MLEDAIREHAAALNNLAEAIKASVPANFALAESYKASVSTYGTSVNITNTAAVVPEPEAKELASKGPYYWKDADTNYFGKETTKKAFEKMLGEKPSIVAIDEAEYKKLEAELRERNSKPVSQMADEVSTGEPPTVEDVIAVFTKYLPKELDAEERKLRHAFVKPLLQRFGVSRATELLPEHRALAISLVERKMAGEDIDPTESGGLV